MKTTTPIKWRSIEVLTAHIKPTEKNYKIRNALGRERLTQSLKLFGLAGNVVVNPIGNGKYMLIDGNSRLEQALEKSERKIWVSVPNRTLTPKEFTEMSAMFDVAKAGDVDMERIYGDLGKTKDFYDKWSQTVPKHLLDKLGVKQMKSYKDEKKDKKSKSTALKVSDDKNLNDIVMVQLLFKQHESEEFRAMEQKLMQKYKTKATHETVLVAFRRLLK